MFIKTGPVYDIPNEGAGGAGGGGGGDAAHPVAPWNGAEGVWKIGEGETAQPWWSSIPEPEARAHVEAKQYSTPAELALANYNLTKMQRGADDVFTIPGQDAPDEQRAQFYNDLYTKLGRPDAPDAYDLKFGEGVNTDETMMKFGKELFHEMGLNNTQAQKAAEKWNEFVAAQETSLLELDKTKNDQGLQELTTRWGAELDANKAAGQRVVQALGLSTDLINRVENSIGSAAVVELLATIGRKTDEGAFKGGGGNGDPNNPASMTKEQAQARITELQGDAEFQKKYTDKAHPGHREALQFMENLFSRV